MRCFGDDLHGLVPQVHLDYRHDKRVPLLGCRRHLVPELLDRFDRVEGGGSSIGSCCGGRGIIITTGSGRLCLIYFRLFHGYILGSIFGFFLSDGGFLAHLLIRGHCDDGIQLAELFVHCLRVVLARISSIEHREWLYQKYSAGRTIMICHEGIGGKTY